MTGKRYRQLGKSETVRVASETKQWCQQIVRILDTKKDPYKTMKLLLTIAEETK